MTESMTFCFLCQVRRPGGLALQIVCPGRRVRSKEDKEDGRGHPSLVEVETKRRGRCEAVNVVLRRQDLYKL